MKFLNLTTKLFLLVCLISVTLASAISPRRYSLSNRLAKQGVNATTIGCKCIMSAPTKDKTDSTMCMCFNRKDGTMNESSKCTVLTDAVFTFCTDVTNDTKLWQQCVKHYCPCNDDETSKTPLDKINF